jgi:glc operon protein GlcG
MNGERNVMKRTACLLFAVLLPFTTTDARAQGATAAPLEKVTLSGAAAQRALTKTQINAATARAIVDACVDFAKASNASYSIFVLAPTGEIVEAHVMDGQVPIGVETALLKAKTALYARTPSGAVAQRFNTVEGRLIRLDLGEASGLAYYFVPGGLPIVVDGQLIGAIGVGGGGQDEQCAHTALTKVLGPQPPLTPPSPPQRPPQ